MVLLSEMGKTEGGAAGAGVTMHRNQELCLGHVSSEVRIYHRYQEGISWISGDEEKGQSRR